MKFPLGFIALICGLCILSITCQKLNTVKITVYYDAAGNASAIFFIHQLYPAYAILRDQLILELIPFCLAAMQPGTFNYEANVIHQCAFAQSDNEKIQLEFATCLMKFGTSGNITENAKNCTTNTTLSYDEIVSCANSDEGLNRLINNGFATKSVYPSLYQLPAIATNGWVNQAHQSKAKSNFLQYVCACLNNPPAGCSRTSA